MRSFKMDRFVFAILFHVLSKEEWRAVVRSQELIDQLPSENVFHPNLISRSPKGLLEYNKEEDYDDAVSDPSSISTSESCLRYILQLMGYIHECEMCIHDFIFVVEDRLSSRKIEPSILFEYFLLLVQRYFQLLAVEKEEEEEDEELFKISDDENDRFENMKVHAQVLFSLLNFERRVGVDLPQVLPILHLLIDLFMDHFPYAMYLVVLGNYQENGIESLSLVEQTFQGMQSLCNVKSFRDLRVLQTLDDFKGFSISSYFTAPSRFDRIFSLLIKRYCVQLHYTENEMMAAIRNICAFLINKLSTESAFDALKHLFTELGKTPNECAQLLFEAIIQNEIQRIKLVLSNRDFSPNVQQIRTILGQSLLPEIFRDQYKALVTLFSKDADKGFLKQTLIDLTKSSSLAQLVFGSLFNSSMLPRIPGKNLESLLDSVFDAKVNAMISNARDADGEYKRFKTVCDSEIISTNKEETKISDMIQMLDSLHVLCLRMSQDPTVKDALTQIKGEATPTEFRRTETAFSAYREPKSLKEIREETAAALAELQKKNRGNYCKLRVKNDECKKLRNEAIRLILECILNCSS